MSEEENIHWQTVSRKFTHDRRTLTIGDFSAETDPIDFDDLHVTIGGLETLWELRIKPDALTDDRRVTLVLVNREDTPVSRSVNLSISFSNRDGKHKLDMSETENLLWYHVPQSIPLCEVLEEDTLTLHLEFKYVPPTKDAVEDIRHNMVDIFDNSKFDIRHNMVIMFDNPKFFSDCVVECDGKEFQCHKNILTCGSEVFYAALTSGMKEDKESRISIPDFDPLIIEDMLRFMYGGKVECLEEKAGELLGAANKYNVAELKGSH